MDDESGEDERDGLTSWWRGESRQDWWGWRSESGSWFQREGDAYLSKQYVIFNGRERDNRWGAGTARRLKREKIVKTARLNGCKNFVGVGVVLMQQSTTNYKHDLLHILFTWFRLQHISPLSRNKSFSSCHFISYGTFAMCSLTFPDVSMVLSMLHCFDSFGPLWGDNKLQHTWKAMAVRRLKQ